jgi:hypothetical protein
MNGLKKYKKECIKKKSQGIGASRKNLPIVPTSFSKVSEAKSLGKRNLNLCRILKEKNFS